MEKKRNTRLSHMTDEEKLEHKRKQMRDYMKNRKEKDPDFAMKQKDFVKQHTKVLRENPEYVEKEKTYNKIYYEKRKKEYEEMKLLVKSLNIGK